MVHRFQCPLYLIFLISNLVIGLPAEQLQAVSRSSMPIWGNHCGFDHGDLGKTGGGRCKDKLDCACRKHDYCFKDVPFPNCYCDHQFRKELKRFRGARPGEEAMRVAILGYFHLAVCKYPVDVFNGLKKCRKCTRIFGWKKCWNTLCTKTRCIMFYGFGLSGTKKKC